MFQYISAYAGSTFWSALAACLLCGVLVGFIAAGLVAWRRRSRTMAYVLGALLVVWFLAWLGGAGALDHAWFYWAAQSDRSRARYRWLTCATAFCPPRGEKGVHAFVRAVYQDLGFAQGKPASVRTTAQGVWKTYEDEDYPEGVVTLNDRPVRTGTRFRPSRLLLSLIPALHMQTQGTLACVGEEADVFCDTFRTLGFSLQDLPSTTNLQALFIAPAPDWVYPRATSCQAHAHAWKNHLAPNACVALHLDVRQMSLGRLKARMCDFRKAFGPFQLWAPGLYDYVLVAQATPLSDHLLACFDETSPLFPSLLKAQADNLVSVFASFVGTDTQIIPALEKASSAPVRLARLTPFNVPDASTWFRPSSNLLAEVHVRVTNACAVVQGARRELLLGFEDPARFASTNAVAHWTCGAQMNPQDPILLGFLDTLDVQARRLMRLGNMKGALQGYENALALAPDQIPILHNYGVCLKKAGHYDLAAQVFSRALARDPTTVAHRLELVACCAAIHREDLACAHLESLIQDHPKDPALAMRASRLYCVRTNPKRNFKRAIHLAEEAVRLTQWKDAGYIQALADVYIECAQPKLGVELKKKLKSGAFACDAEGETK